MEKLWVVECQFSNGWWGVCDFTQSSYTSKNYYEAHKQKRIIQKYLQKQGSEFWCKNRFRVRVYSNYHHLVKIVFNLKKELSELKSNPN